MSRRTYLDLTFLLSVRLALVSLVGACGTSADPERSAVVSVFPTELWFERPAPGSSESRSVLIENLGAVELVVAQVDVHGAPDFAVVGGYDGEPLVIQAFDGAELVVEYTATATAVSSGVLVLHHNGMRNQGVTRVPLEVRESLPRLSVTPDPVDFGRVAGGVHMERRVALMNEGGASLTVTDLLLSDDNDVFSIPAEYLLALPITLARDERYELTVACDPLDDAYVRARLVVESNAPVALHEVEVVGNGPTPCIAIMPVADGAYDFGERALSRAHEPAFTVSNCSDPTFGEPLIVTGIALADDSSSTFALAQLPEFPLELAPGEDRAFIVQFTPTVEFQVEQGTLVIDSNDPYTPELEIALNGIGTSIACPVARALCTIDGSGAPPASDLFALPLDRISCTGPDSEDIDGESMEYIWTVVERPDGSTAEFEPDNRERTSFFVDLAGRFVFSLEVVDDRGCVSEPSLVTLVARPCEDVHVQLVWSTPSDPDPNDYGFGAGTDIDLHLVHPNGCWEDLQYDCHFRSREPNWGAVGASNDDPSLDIDDTDGWGPENINLNNPENGVTYKVGAHYHNDHGYGVSYATVRIYVFGELLYEARDKEFPYADFWWEVAAIHWPTAEITPIDLVYDHVPPCDL